MHRPARRPSWPELLHIPALLLLAVSLPRTAAAESWLVRPDLSGDAPTIQAAVDSAAPGDTIVLADGVFTGTGNRDIRIQGKPLVVRSLSNDPALCVIDCEPDDPGFHQAIVIDSVGGASVAGSGFAALSGVTFTGGDGHFGGTVVCARSRVEITGCVFDDNFGTYGGGLFITDSCSVTVTGCVFSNNEAIGDGAISFYGTDLAVSDCLFVGNRGLADGPGAIWAIHGTLSLENCAFIDNWTKWDGGALQLNSNVEATIRNCTFAGNAAQFGSGSALTFEGPVTLIERSIIAYNGPGAAVYGCSDSLEVACNDFYGNPDGNYYTGLPCLAGLDTLGASFSLNPLFCDTLGGNYTLASLSPCLPANNTCGVLVGARGQGCDVPSGAGDRNPPATGTVNLRAAPNPFNPRTVILYDLPRRAPATLVIYDVNGRRIRSLVDGTLPAGPHDAAWDGRTDRGSPAASGIYFARLESGGNTRSIKLLLLK